MKLKEAVNILQHRNFLDSEGIKIELYSHEELTVALAVVLSEIEKNAKCTTKLTEKYGAKDESKTIVSGDLENFPDDICQVPIDEMVNHIKATGLKENKWYFVQVTYDSFPIICVFKKGRFTTKKGKEYMPNHCKDYILIN